MPGQAYPAAPPPGGYAEVQGGGVGVPANFGLRFGAWLIDAILIGVITGILGAGIGGFGRFLGFLIGIAYYSYLEGERGQTLGKQVLNIKVVDQNTGGNIGLGKGVGRYFARWISAIPCLLGFFWMLWDGESQTWHDKIVTTRVVVA